MISSILLFMLFKHFNLFLANVLILYTLKTLEIQFI